MSDMKKYYYNRIKERLHDFSEQQSDIDLQVERYERLKAKVYGIGASEITDMPKAHSNDTDRNADKIASLEKLDKSIRRSVEIQSRTKDELEDVLSLLKKANERAVIRMRYIDCMPWRDITEAMYYTKPEFEDRVESFLRRAMEAHEKSINDMADMVIECKEGKKPLPAFLKNL